MSEDCRICGWPGMLNYHKGAVDCLNAYRVYVEELRALLPRGKQVLCASISRDSDARLWIEGEITYESLQRLMTFIGFMQEAWTTDNGETCDNCGQSLSLIVKDQNKENSTTE